MHVSKSIELVLIRHGQSQWNLENRFTGWVNVDLSARGISEAQEAGRVLKQSGYEFDIALTSVLKRCERTLEIVLDEMGQSQLPVRKDWRLNERHYGALQGLNKKEMIEKHGAEQVLEWRRSYRVRPPALSGSQARKFGADEKYGGIKAPATESLHDTYLRVVQYWDEVVSPLLADGNRVLIAGHGNSLRALAKHLDKISDSEISQLNIPTGVPLVYELDPSLEPLKHYYLADEEKIKAAISEVRNQTAH